MAEVEASRIIAGKYRLDERIAAGGMGAIWKGWDLRLETPVAIKFMRKELAEDAPQRARFEREAKAAAQIRSPHVVHMYDHGIDKGTPYIVMEWLDGEDLGQRIKRVGQLPLLDVRRICTEICRGLHRAHRLDIVHRDLKPGNVFLSAPDDDLIKILDFGIAKAKRVKAVGAEATTTGQLLGSPHYMSPEQARGMALDGRSDLWSLAIILFRALTAEHPFRGVEIGDLIVRICTDAVPPPSKYRPGLGPSIDRFFERALQRDPTMRFQAAKEFAGAFEEAVEQSDGQSAHDSLDESSWDSSGSRLLPATLEATAVTTTGGRSRSTQGIDDGGVDLIAPTPTHPSGTLGSLAAEPRPTAPRKLWMVGAGLLALGVGGVLALQLGSPHEPSDADQAGASTSAAQTVTATSGASTAVDQASSTPPEEDEEDAGIENSDAAESATTSSAAEPRPRPDSARPVVPSRPKPQPKPGSPGFKPSDLGY